MEDRILCINCAAVATIKDLEYGEYYCKPCADQYNSNPDPEEHLLTISVREEGWPTVPEGGEMETDKKKHPYDDVEDVKMMVDAIGETMAEALSITDVVTGQNALHVTLNGMEYKIVVTAKEV